MSMTDLYKVFDQTVREITREVNRSILKVPEVEQKALDATSNEPWGPHGQVMNELARATRNYHEFQMIMAILWKRLQDTGANWRHVYKSLVVMEFLVANGSDRVVDELRENMYQISTLQEFQYLEPNGKDQGINVRKKAQTLIALLKDREKIREAREKAASNRNKYGGISSTAYRSGGSFGGGGSGGGGYDGFEGGSRRDDGDSYRSGGAGRRGSYDDEPYGGRRERDDVDRYRGREGGGYDDDFRRGGDRPSPRRGGAGGDWDDDFKTDGYSRAGQTTLQDDDDDFAPRGKASGGKPEPAAAAVDDDDWDDFDPRGSAKPSGPPPGHAPPPAPAPAPAVDLLDLLGPDPTPTSAPAPAAAPVDPFAALSGRAPAAPAPAASMDLFGGPAAPAAAASPFSTFGAAPAPAKTATAAATDDFGDDDFGGFAAAPSSAAAGAARAPAAPVAAAPDPFGDPFASFASAPAPAAPKLGAAPAAAPLAKPPSTSKGGLWEDAISKGIVDLKISGGKEDLSSLGILGDGLGSGPAALNPASNVPFAQQAGGMGRAMGAGSGKGIAGASSLSPTLMPVATPGGIPQMGGLGGGLGSPGSMGGFVGAPPPAMAMPGFPGHLAGAVSSAGMYGGVGSPQGVPNLFSPQGQQQQHSLNAFQF